MSKSTTSKPRPERFWPIVVITLGLWALLLVVAQPFRVAGAANLMKTADHQSGVQQLASARVAVMLSPHNDSYRVKLADMYLKRGSAEMALRILPTASTPILQLKRAQILYAGGKYEEVRRELTNVGTAEAYILRSKALLELSDGVGAANTAKRASSVSGTRMEALSYAVLGNLAALAVLEPNLPPNDYLAMRSGGLALVRLLQQNDLPLAAQKVLVASPDNSTVKFSLLAELALQGTHTGDSLKRAAVYLEKGISLDPSNISLHQKLLSVAKEQKNLDLVNTETLRIHALETGII